MNGRVRGPECLRGGVSRVRDEGQKAKARVR